MREATTRYVLLGTLALGGEMTGFDIRSFIERSVAFFWRESFGQIYPELQRMAADGLIEPAGRRARSAKLWRITPAGREALTIKGTRPINRCG